MIFIKSVQEKNYELTEIQLQVHSSPPWTKSVFAVETKSELPMPLPIGSFFKYLVKGELMAFLPNI